MYRDKVAKEIREQGLDIDDYPLYERRRGKRLFMQRWGMEAEEDDGPVPLLFSGAAGVRPAQSQGFEMVPGQNGGRMDMGRLRGSGNGSAGIRVGGL